MKIAISPCPNDTYLFHAWIAGLLDAPPPEVTFADIQELNRLAYKGDFPLIKVSFSSLKRLFPLYELLPVGSALGFNCGPKIVAKTPFPLKDLPLKTIAIPGKNTTAHLLAKRLLPPLPHKQFCLYHEVGSLIEKEEVECGLIIHETRFTFASHGFFELVDLGALWHEKYALPLPLGCLVIKRDYPEKRTIIEILRKSLAFALQNPEASRSFILEHSQEKDPLIVARHIETYVTSETEALSEKGKIAILALTGCRIG